MDNVVIGLFEGDKRNVLDLLGESAVVHITCVESFVDNGKIISGSEHINLTKENGDYYISGAVAGTSTDTTGDAQVDLDISKGNCKFHNESSGDAITTVFVFKKPTTETTTTTLTLTGNLDERCDYFIGGLNYSYCEIFDKIDDSTGILNAIGSAVAELGNKPQEDGADKYGYTFISTDGTDCVLTHPTPDGYTRIANLILDALPDMRYAYSDAAYGTEYYKAVYFMTRNGYMSSVSDTEFGVDEKLTVGALAEALSNMAGQTEADSFAWATEKGFVKTDADSDVGYFELISALNSFSKDQGKADFFYTIRFFIYTVKNMLSGVLFGSLSRGDAAKLICGYCDL